MLNNLQAKKQKPGGVVVVDFSMAARNSKGDVIGLPMGYQALDDLVREKRGDHIIAQVSDLVSRYDPEKESVVLAIAPTDEGCDAHGARMEQRPCHAPIEWSDCRCDAHTTIMGAQFYQNHHRKARNCPQ